MLRNLAKLLLGAGLGAGIGAALAKVAGRAGGQDASVTWNAEPLGELGASSGSREGFKERLERAREAGDVARAAKEEELRRYFRAKVNDPTALTEAPKP